MAKLDLLLTDLQYAVEQGTPPLLPARKRGDPWIAGKEKPLYSQQAIDAAEPVVSTLMRKANLALQREDSLYIAHKESARLEAARKASPRQSQSRRRRQFRPEGDSNDDYSTSTPSVADSQITRITTRSRAAAAATNTRARATPSVQSDFDSQHLMPPPPLPKKRGPGQPSDSSAEESEDSGEESEDSAHFIRKK
jgi:hypothetical protein